MDRAEKARELRIEIVRMLHRAGSGHPGGSLSIVEMLIALYYENMKVDPLHPDDPDRDRFVLSKGHACPAQYAVLADLGFFPKADLASLRRFDSHLQGHPDCRKTPGIDVNTGSLGQGASISVGLALAAKLKKATYHVYTIIGDGECQEGLIWEAAMAAAHYHLDNLTFMVDNNGLQIDGTNKDVMDLGDLSEKFRAFGFTVHDVDGHDIDAINAALRAPAEGKPKFLNCHTIKGKGVSYMENAYQWHGKAPNDELYRTAMLDLGVPEEQI